ncbi:MAG TPA: DUF3592 domain-containing protein [Candidatus Limnocylindrales bacterium]|nr:DUF3592 domain-containing protein [Candidatus Limnocylindrales bacterium]
MNAGPSLMTLAMRSFWLLFGAVFLSVGLVFLIIGVPLMLGEQRFEAEAVAAEGTVLTKTIRRANTDDGDSTEYRVTYRFTTTDGRTIQDSDAIGVEAWEALTEQGPIAVEYLARDPETNRVAGADGWLLVGITLGLGGVLVALGGVLFLAALRRLLLQRRLWRSGLRTEGQVIGVEETNVRFNGRQMWRFRYRYVDQLGQGQTGKSGYLSFAQATAWQAGDRGEVRYDAEHPERSLWAGTPAAPTQAEPGAAGSSA